MTQIPEDNYEVPHPTVLRGGVYTAPPGLTAHVKSSAGAEGSLPLVAWSSSGSPLFVNPRGQLAFLNDTWTVAGVSTH